VFVDKAIDDDFSFKQFELSGDEEFKSTTLQTATLQNLLHQLVFTVTT
jgi:hypothetical protein